MYPNKFFYIFSFFLTSGTVFCNALQIKRDVSIGCALEDLTNAKVTLVRRSLRSFPRPVLKLMAATPARKWLGKDAKVSSSVYIDPLTKQECIICYYTKNGPYSKTLFRDQVRIVR